MQLAALKSLPVIAGAKLLLAVTSPLQHLIDQPGITHEFCNFQAIAILREDGFTRCAEFMEQYVRELNAGVYWADKGWKNVSHYFEPASGKGLWRFSSAIEDFRGYFQTAMACVRNQNYSQAVFFLGAAAHLVQDLCVPHHARAKLFNGHKEYEAWVQQNRERYAVINHGLYEQCVDAHLYALSNALVAADLFDWVNNEEAGAGYHEATAILLSQAQRSTAGLFQQFFAAIGNVTCRKTVTVA